MNTAQHDLLALFAHLVIMEEILFFFFWFAWISLSNGVRRERMTLVKYLTSTATDARHYLIAPEHTHTLGSNFHNTD